MLFILSCSAAPLSCSAAQPLSCRCRCCCFIRGHSPETPRAGTRPLIPLIPRIPLIMFPANSTRLFALSALLLLLLLLLLLQGLCCKGSAAGARLEGLCCRGYAAGATLQGLCCRGEHPHDEHALHPCSLSTHDEPCLRRSPRGDGLSPATGRESILIMSMLCTPAHVQPMTNPAFSDAPGETACHRSVGGRASSSRACSAPRLTFNP